MILRLLCSDDIVAIFKALHIVDNSSPSSIGGGGVPRQPRAAPICAGLKSDDDGAQPMRPLGFAPPPSVQPRKKAPVPLPERSPSKENHDVHSTLSAKDASRGNTHTTDSPTGAASFTGAAAGAADAVGAGAVETDPPEADNVGNQEWSAIYDYTAIAMDEISCIAGDIIVNVKPVPDNETWVSGALVRTGACGTVPASYLRLRVFWTALYDYTASDADEVSCVAGDEIVDVTLCAENATWMHGTVVRTNCSGNLPKAYIQHPDDADL